MTGKKLLALVLGWIVLAAVTLPAADETSAEDAAEANKFLSQFKWFKGPGTASMKSVAEIEVPAGYMFTDGDSTRTILKAFGNLTDDTEIGFLSPTNLDWFIVFSFSDEGYVKDDDKDKLDAVGMLKTIRSNNDYANEEKRRIGLPEMKIVGWEKEPSYDAQSQNLEWAIQIESEGDLVVNYNTRILGRHGIMEVALVVDPTKLQSTLPTFKEMLAAYKYKPGETYAEYRPGDKMAKYGLAALITGAGVAVAAKTGLLAWAILLVKKGWKLVVAAVVAVGVFLKRLIVGRSERTSME